MKRRDQVTICLPPLDGEMAAWLVDLLATLQQAIWQRDGEAIEAYWMASDPPNPKQRRRLGEHR